MKFSVDQKTFSGKIKQLARVAAKSNIGDSVLKGIKITTDRNGLKMTAGNSDYYLRIGISASDKKSKLNVSSTGDIVVSAKLFSQFVSSLPSGVMTFNSDLKNSLPTIVSGSSKFSIESLDGSNYPHLPKIDISKATTISGDILKEIIKETSFAVSKGQMRPILTGVHFEANKGVLKAISTDSHILVYRQLSDGQKDATYSLVIPVATLKELHALIGSGENVKMAASSSGSQIKFVTKHTELLSRLIQGNYPDVSGILKAHHNTTVSAKADVLRSVVDRAALVAHASRNNVIRLQISPKNKTFQVSADASSTGTAHEETAVDNATGEDLTISVNPDYLSSELKALSGQQAKINFGNHVQPAVITPVKPKEGKSIQMITPIRTF